MYLRLSWIDSFLFPFPGKTVYNIFEYSIARCKMSEKPVQFVIAVFEDEAGAEETLSAVVKRFFCTASLPQIRPMTS